MVPSPALSSAPPPEPAAPEPASPEAPAPAEAPEVTAPEPDPPGEPAPPEAPADPARGARALRIAAISAIAAHLAAFAYFARIGRFFACEDDPYRAYLAWLTAGGEGIIGRFWLPGHLVAMAIAQRLGVPVVWSGIAVGTLSVIGLGAAVAGLARAFAPEDLRPAAPWAALLLVAASPMTLTVGHSALAEPLECALIMGGALALVRRARGGPRWLLAPLVLAIGAATWVRYEAWPIALALPGVLYLVRRRAGDAPRAAAIEAAIGALPLLGPAAWFWQQAAHYHNPIAFVEQVDDMSKAMTGDPSSLHVLHHRLWSLARWAPATIVWAAVAAYALRDRPAARSAAAWTALVASLGVIAAVLLGREHATFVDRLAYEVEVALFPLAALGLAWVASRRPGAAIAGAVATAALLALGVLHRPEIYDHASVTAGLLLRRGDLAQKVGSGALMVERQQRRPPFGWASLGVQWAAWDRIVWGTRRRDGWEVTDPINVRGRRTLPPAELQAYLDQRKVTAVWALSPITLAEVGAAWPKAKVLPIEEGILVMKE